MRIYWWNGGLHMKPETKDDNEHLKGLMRLFETAQVGLEKPTGTGVRESRRRQESEVVEPGLEII